MKPASSKLLSLLFIISGVTAVIVSLPTATDTPVVLFASIIGAAFLIFLSAQLSKGIEWARDILLIASILMTLLAAATILAGFSFSWLLIGLVSLYITWSLITIGSK